MRVFAPGLALGLDSHLWRLGARVDGHRDGIGWKRLEKAASSSNFRTTGVDVSRTWKSSARTRTCTGKLEV
jgi:hypothetical protein